MEAQGDKDFNKAERTLFKGFLKTPLKMTSSPSSYALSTQTGGHRLVDGGTKAKSNQSTIGQKRSLYKVLLINT